MIRAGLNAGRAKASLAQQKLCSEAHSNTCEYVRELIGKDQREQRVQ